MDLFLFVDIDHFTFGNVQFPLFQLFLFTSCSHRQCLKFSTLFIVLRKLFRKPFRLLLRQFLKFLQSQLLEFLTYIVSFLRLCCSNSSNLLCYSSSLLLSYYAFFFLDIFFFGFSAVTDRFYLSPTIHVCGHLRPASLWPVMSVFLGLLSVYSLVFPEAFKILYILP